MSNPIPGRQTKRYRYKILVFVVISNLLSKKKLTYSQICNNLPYHSTENNFVYNMISSRNSNRIDKVNDMMNNMRNSFEMMSLKNSVTATTGYNNNSNNHSNLSLHLN